MLFTGDEIIMSELLTFRMLGSVVRSDAPPPGVQTVAGSILGSVKTFFRGE